MRIERHKFLAVSVFLAVGALAGCNITVETDPALGSIDSGGVGGSAGAGGATADGAAPEGGAFDAPSGDAPGADGTSADATEDGVAPDTMVDGPAADVATTFDASDASTADATAVDATAVDATATDGGNADGAITDAASDATGACFAEDGVDAGPSPGCASLPYYGTVCSDDAGLDWPPDGATLCDTLAPDLKASAFQQLYACLLALPGADGGIDACSTEHEDGAAACSRGIFNRSMCPVLDGAADGGLYGCAQIVASCGPDSGDGGITLDLCQAWLGPFNATTRQAIIDCYLDPDDMGATSCRDKFENYCVFP